MAEPAKTQPTKIRRRAVRTANRRRQGARPVEEWIGWGGVAIFLVALGLTVLYALLLTHIRGEVVQLGYEIRQLADRMDTLQWEVNEQQLKRQELCGPERLERLAVRLKLSKPEADQIVVVNDR